MQSQHPETAALRFSAPARVNLIGEHTDYSGGLVMPMAIPFATTATVQPATGSAYTFTTDMFANTRTMSVDDRSARPEGAPNDWSDYPVGVLRELQKLGICPAPFTLHLHGDVPLGAGLSSSASVEVATAMALLAWSGTLLSITEIALLCRRAENLYVGSPCGIMDQFVVTAAVAGFALLIDTRELTYQLLPLKAGELANTQIVVFNSGVKHSVATGEYGVRRREVDAGQAAVCARFPQLRDLGDATLAQLEACRSDMSEESFLRCRHIVTENARVRQAAAAMTAGDPIQLGELLSAAHVSFRDDFAASCEEVDFLVEAAQNLRGCYGARMTGGGFGGCTVNLVATDQVAAFSESLLAAYKDKFHLTGDVFVCDPVDGAVALAAAAIQSEQPS